MALALINGCWFVAGSSGLADFDDGVALTGYRNLVDAGAVGAAVYSYRAKHPTDDSIWEIGRGAYTASPSGIARTTIVASSTGAKINFSVAPVISIEPIKEDFGDAAGKNTGTGAGTVAAGDDSRITGAVQTSRSVASGAGLTGGGDLSADRTLAVGAGTGILANADDVAVDKASDANVRAAASNKVLTTDLIESASALVALTDAAPVAVDWDAGVNFSLTVTTNRQIGNPTNGQPGTWRTITVQGNDGTDRTITFGNQFLGSVPTITDCDSGIWYLLTLFCVTASHFHASAIKVKG